MKKVRRLLQIIYSAYAILLFVSLMLIVVPFVFVFSSFKSETGNDLVYTTCRIWAEIWYFLLFIRFKKEGYFQFEKKRAFIIVSNHSSYIDIPQMLLSVQNPFRVLGRHDLAKVPLFGIIYRAAVIAVDRNNRADKVKSVLKMNTVLKQNISLFIFPEGSFNESSEPLKNFYDGAFRIASETGTPILPVIFPDTKKRLHYSSVLSFTPGICRTVYLAPVEANGQTAAALRTAVFDKMSEALIISRKKATL